MVIVRTFEILKRGTNKTLRRNQRIVYESEETEKLNPKGKRELAVRKTMTLQ